MTTNPSQKPLPEIDEAFRQQVNQIYEAWHANSLNFVEASAQLEQLRQQAIADGNQLNEAGIYNILGIMHGYRSDYGQAIEMFNQARELYEPAGALRRVATVDLNIGETYRLLGNFTRARKHFHRAYEVAGSFDDPSLQSVALANESQVWLSLKDPDKARDVLQQALDLVENHWEPKDDADAIRRADNACEIHHTYVSLLLAEGNARAAWKHATQAYECAEFSGRIMRMGYATRALGDVITELGQSLSDEFSSDVDYHYAEAISAFKQVKAEGEVAKTLLAQGQSLAKRGNKRSASNKYQQAMAIFTRLGMMDAAAEAARAQEHII